MTISTYPQVSGERPADKPLAELLGAPMPVDAFLGLAARMAHALSDVHRRGILHKNLNPRTISVNTATGDVTITDFRSASYLPREQPTAQSQSALEGAPEYMSPEQTGRMNRRIDHRSDLYSLGVTLYQLLTGRLPLSGADALGWVHAHIALTPRHPRELVPSVPDPIADIVMRLLAKDADERYESALGLARDLERARESLERTGHIDPFPLGQEDTWSRLSVPQRLYGRDTELHLLLGAFDCVVATGMPQFVTVSGYAGIGKSSLVHELHKPLLRARGILITGKSEQYNRGIPYFTLVLAFRELTAQLLTESDEDLAPFRADLQRALGVNGRLITDMLPEMKLIVGEQPPTAELGPTEAQNRFLIAFQSFIRAIARPEHPIALFLDDLQWADAATLDLLAVLASDPELRHITFILAYRDNEVDEAHPLRAALEKIKRSGAEGSDIRLTPLDLESTNALVADTLRCSPSLAEPLARLVLQKTGGNPFFAGEFLKALHQEGLLTYDPERRGFRWDEGRIMARSITANVVDLLLDRLKRLPPETLRALTIASCIGATFRLELLAGITGEPAADVARDLLPAVQEELIGSVGAAYPRVIPREPDAREAVYRFEHDRIQQAAYSLLDDEKKRVIHLSVGRMLLEQTPPEGVSDALFEIVNQLNFGLALVTDEVEKSRLLDLNAAAGRKAKASNAFAPARSYLRIAKALSPDDAWTSRYGETLAIHCDLAECEHMCGHFAEGDALLDLATERARDLIDEGKIYVLRLLCYEKTARIPEGLALGSAALRRFGIETPPDAESAAAAFGVELATIKELLGDRPIADLINAPLMPEGIAKTTMVLLAHVNGFAYMLRPELFPLFNAKSVILALKHGNGPYCAKAYGPFSVIQIIVFGDVVMSYELSHLALALCEKFNDIRTRQSVLFSHGAMVSLWREHYDTAVKYTEECFTASLDTGDYGNGNYAAQDLPLLRFARGDGLESIAQETKRYEALARTSGQASNVRVLQTIRQVMQALRGLTPQRGSLADETFDDAAMLAVVRSGELVMEAAFSRLVRLILAFFYGRYEEALAWAESTRAVLAPHSARVGEALYVVYRGLTLAALYPAASPEAQGAYRKELAECEAKLAHWAASCPENFRDQHLLLSAEIARIEGRALEAMSLYEQAAGAAKDARFIHGEALARELAARFFLGLGQSVAARGQLAEAIRGYKAWGADGKVAALEEAYPALVPPKQAPSYAEGASGAALDSLSAIAASQALSGEIERERLLHRLMSITLQSAAAERGCLLRVRGDQLVVLAEAGTDKGEVKTTLRDAASGGEISGIPLSILHFVRRSAASVVLDDASRDARFASDPQITKGRPRSVMCLPLLRQAELIAILYLENNLTTGAFTKDHTAVLELLASQAAISLENATLYAELKQENVERKRAEEEVRTLNRDLEQRVLERTAELAETNADLATANRELAAANRELEAFSYSVSHDLQAPARRINGFMDMLLEDYGPDLDATARGYMTRARALSQRMIELTEDMLHLARVTRAEMQCSDLDMSALAREVAQALHDRTPGRVIEWAIAEGLGAHADPRLVRILLENLLGNAFKFTGKRPESRIELGVREEPDGPKTYFVRDNGAGFDMSKVSRLFGVFERLHKDTEFAGTGIGLATAQRIVARHGGRIWAEGAVNQGATFYFTL